MNLELSRGEVEDLIASIRSAREANETLCAQFKAEAQEFCSIAKDFVDRLKAVKQASGSLGA